MAALVSSRWPLRALLAAPWARGLSFFEAGREPAVHVDALRSNPGSKKVARRWGRGVGSGRGKRCGRGQKGFKAREGSHVKVSWNHPFYKRLPKIHEPFRMGLLREYVPTSISRLLQWIDRGRIDPSKPITIKTMFDSRLVSIKNKVLGVYLTEKGSEHLSMPLHLQVTDCTEEAKKAVERAGGTVTLVYYNRLGLRALLKPHRFCFLPRNARPPPKLWARYAPYMRWDPVKGVVFEARAQENKEEEEKEEEKQAPHTQSES